MDTISSNILREKLKALLDTTYGAIPFGVSSEFLFEVARGNISGIKSYIIVGRKDSISTTALDDISQIPATTVIPDGGGIQMEVVSSSASDTSDGDGARTVGIHYLDSDGVEQEEDITLNGVTPVNTVATDINHVQWMHVKARGGGATETAIGNISLRSTDGATTYEYIAAGGNQSLSCRYVIPANKTGYILGWHCAAISKQIDFRLRSGVKKFDRSAIQPHIPLFQDAFVLNDSVSGHIPFRVPLMCPAGSHIKVSGLSAASGGNGSAQFEVLVIDD